MWFLKKTKTPNRYTEEKKMLRRTHDVAVLAGNEERMTSGPLHSNSNHNDPCLTHWGSIYSDQKPTNKLRKFEIGEPIMALMSPPPRQENEKDPSRPREKYKGLYGGSSPSKSLLFLYK